MNYPRKPKHFDEIKTGNGVLVSEQYLRSIASDLGIKLPHIDIMTAVQQNDPAMSNIKPGRWDALAVIHAGMIDNWLRKRGKGDDWSHELAVDVIKAAARMNYENLSEQTNNEQF